MHNATQNITLRAQYTLISVDDHCAVLNHRHSGMCSAFAVVRSRHTSMHSCSLRHGKDIVSYQKIRVQGTVTLNCSTRPPPIKSLQRIHRWFDVLNPKTRRDLHTYHHTPIYWLNIPVLLRFCTHILCNRPQWSFNIISAWVTHMWLLKLLPTEAWRQRGERWRCI